MAFAKNPGNAPGAPEMRKHPCHHPIGMVRPTLSTVPSRLVDLPTVCAFERDDVISLDIFFDIHELVVLFIVALAGTGEDHLNQALTRVSSVGHLRHHSLHIGVVSPDATDAKASGSIATRAIEPAALTGT